MDYVFKKFGGEQVQDLGKYLQKLVTENPSLYICAGCDSKQLRGSTLYVVAVTIHSPLYRNGAHVIFTRIREKKVRDDFTRLWKETEYLIEVADEIHHALQEVNYVRKEMDVEKGALKICEDGFYKLVELHVDYNETSRYLSNKVYQAAIPYLKGMGYKTLGKPLAYAATCAADLKCKL